MSDIREDRGLPAEFQPKHSHNEYLTNKCGYKSTANDAFLLLGCVYLWEASYSALNTNKIKYPNTQN